MDLGYLGSMGMSGAFLGIVAVLGGVAYADPGPVGDISPGAIQASLQGSGGSGWGPSGPGGGCAPSSTVNCIDAASVQVLAKQLLSAIVGSEITDPTLLAAVARIQGAKTETKSTDLELSLYFDQSFEYDFPVAKPGATPSPLKSLTLPQTFVLEVSSNGQTGTLRLQKPLLRWRQTTLSLVPTALPVNLYVEELDVDLLTSEVSIEAGYWDVLSLWESGQITNFSLKLDTGRTLLANLELFLLPWVLH